MLKVISENMSSSVRYKFMLLSIFIVSTVSTLVSTEYIEYPPLLDEDIIIHDVVKRQVETVLVERNACIDENENCRRWAKRNFCSHADYAPYMSLKCRRSCYLCEVVEEEVEECRDDRDACAYWKESGNCNKDKYRKFMAKLCPRSCGLCPDQVTSTIFATTTASTVPVTTTVTTTTTEEPIETTTPAKYSEWGEWSECSHTCGTGNKRRTRECLLETCTSMQVKSCANQPCPTTTATTTTTTTTTELATTQEETTSVASTTVMATSSETTFTEAATTTITTSTMTEEITEQLTTTFENEVTTATDTTTTESASASSTMAEIEVDATDLKNASTTIATLMETTADAEMELTTVSEVTTGQPETTQDNSMDFVTTSPLETTQPEIPVTSSVKMEETTTTNPTFSPVTPKTEKTSAMADTTVENEPTTIFETTSYGTMSTPEDAFTSIESTSSPDIATTSAEDRTQAATTVNAASETTTNILTTVPTIEVTATETTASSMEVTTDEGVSATGVQSTTLQLSAELTTNSYEPTSTEVDITSQATASTTMVSGNEGCQDKARSCVLLLFSCKTSQFTRNTCKATCGLCETPVGVSTTTPAQGTTADETTSSTITESQTTATTANAATSTEPITSSRPVAPSCTDRTSTCRFFISRGCSSTVMRTLCKATCKLCGSSTTLPQTTSTADVITTSSMPQTTSTILPTSTIATSSVSSTTLSPSTSVAMTSSIPASSTVTSSTPASSAMTSTIEQTTQPACIDLYEECANISVYCGVVANVTKSCPRTCGECDDVTTSPASSTVGDVEICEDTFPNCIALLDQCENEEAIQYLQVTCRKTCGFCVAPTPTNVTSTPEPTTAAVECVDTNEKCGEWSQYGLCNSTIYPEMMAYMQDSCRKSCDLCNKKSWSEWSVCSVSCGGGLERRTEICNEGNCSQPQTETRSCNIEACPQSNRCFDGMTTRACQQYKAKNACYTTLVQGLCAKTCGVCVDESATANSTDNNTNETQSNTTTTAGNSTCQDTNELCGNWSSRGFCSNTYTTYMKQNCPQSCGLCSDSVWNVWNTWSPCNATCGGGVMTRNRTCQSVTCQGPTDETAPCNTFQCPTCTDQSSACSVLSQTGKCTETMWKFLCRRSCKLCTVQPITGPCYDTRTDCADLRTAGRCTDFAVEAACPRSCEKCPIVEENTGSGQCVDTNVNCQTAATMGKCTDPRVQAICPLSCKKCTKSVAVVETNPTSGECVDQNSLCVNLAVNCANNSVVRKTCPKTCRLCPEPCVDKNTLCPGLAQAGQCSMKIVTDECPLSCQACNKASQVIKSNVPETSMCEDKLGSCPKLVQIINCTNPMLLESCAKTCGTCLKATVAPTVAPKEETCADQHSSCPVFAEQGQCQKMFYTFLCRKSCRQCDKRQADATVPECKDKYDQATCAALLSKCDNPLVLQQCQRSCKACTDFECRDTITGTCKTLASIGMCSQTEFKRTCAVTCGLCSNGESGGTTIVPTPPTSGVTTDSDVCMDERSDCQEYFNAGHCRYEVIESVCRKTCQVCRSPTAVLDPDAPCMDSSTTCEIFSRLNQCRSTRNVRFMCAKSCNYCPRIESARKSVVPTPECKDSNTAMCDRLKNMCALPNIETACPLTCGKCTAVDKEGTSSNGQSNRPADFKKCRDYLPDCPDYSALCTRKTANNYIPTMCPITCQTCGQTTLAPDRKPTDAAPTTVATTPKIATPQNSGVFEKWGSWTECSKTCGVGERTRTRSCVTGECEGPLVDTGACGKDSCDARLNPIETEGCKDISPLCSRWLQNSTTRCTSVRYREQMKFQCAFSCGHCTPKLVWSEWSDCTNRCGGGKQKRTLSCEIVGKCDNQTGDGNVEERECNTNDCGTWTTWRDWTPCSVTCGQGYRSRERFCPSGRDDDCEGLPMEQEGCFINATCPGWSNWSNWTDCSASCGGGVSTRSRDCYPGKENVTCSGNATEEISCNNQTCPEWSSWETWSDCSVTCGEGGTRQRFRGCSVKGGCKGDEMDTEDCSSDVSCIQWSQWSAYTECSASCGGGVATRNRTCLGGTGDHGECPGFSEQTMPCNWQICPDVGLWSEWGQFGTCTKTCGGGEMERRRVCLNGIPGEGGCPGTVNDVSDCAVESCPVGRWSLWSEWSPCSSSCGVGVKSRDRQCIDGVAGLSGCPGLKESVEKCNEHACPTWTEWQPWTQCSATCGENGERMRVKVCFDSNIEEVVPASECEDSKETFEKEICNIRLCPTWSTWSGWGPCSASCGVGLSQRTRGCDNGDIGDDGCNDGSSMGKRYCNQWDCPKACEMEPLQMTGTFTASSYVEDHPPISAELLASRAWCPTNDDADQWLQIDFADAVSVSGIKIQGFLSSEHHDGVSGYSWVDRFTVHHAITAGDYQPITNNAQEEKIFEGPDGPLSNHARSRFWEPVAARYWRIKVESSVPEKQGCMKVQFLQCQDNADTGSGSSLLF
uniref:SCO-spondin n=1 Tax=Phallusia mammillata TaxID=59560 RepID=A0A6F9DT38_9ASCI|nr:SCO-spondin [Phallusia mammillata]